MIRVWNSGAGRPSKAGEYAGWPCGRNSPTSWEEAAIQRDRLRRTGGQQLGRHPEISMKILVIDIGGTNVKMLASGHENPRKFPSGPDLTPEQMVAGVLPATKDWDYEAVSIGFPGPVLCGQPMTEPVNLGPGWMGFDFAAAL